jgi:ABC-type sugar transport system ATPase subunit
MEHLDGRAAHAAETTYDFTPRRARWLTSMSVVSACTRPTSRRLVRALQAAISRRRCLRAGLRRNQSCLSSTSRRHGVDVGAKAEISELIRGLARDGIAILLISSELTEVLALSSRIVVMREGRVMATLDRDEADERLVMMHATGSAPASTHSAIA